MEFDARLPELKSAMRKGDIMMLTADHGNDPVHSGFDHTREYTPLVAFGAGVRAGVNLGTRGTFADIGATIADYLGAAAPAIGASFLKDILK